MKTRKNEKAPNVIVAFVGGLVIFAGGYLCHWLPTRHDVSDTEKKTRAECHKEHAENLKRLKEQRQKENQLFRSIIDNLINHKNEA